jgi:uncharacterized FlaG/YvyC family protein
MPRIDAAIATQIADTARPAPQREAHAVAADLRARTTADPGPAAPVRADDLRAVADQLKAVVEVASGRRLQFQIRDKATDATRSTTGFATDPDHGNQTYVAIRDLDSGEVVRQIPTPEIRELRARLDKIVGLFLDKEA